MRDCTKYAVMSAVMSTMLMLICTSPVYGWVRDNYLYFPIATIAPLKYFAWGEYHHRITSGQTWEYIHSGTTNDPWGAIHVRAGRSGSEMPAAWFKKNARNATHTGAGGHWPDKLNFAFNGHMRLHTTNDRKTVCHDVVIGQGHYPGHNNWWIGGKHMHTAGGKYWLNCMPHAKELALGYTGAVVLITTDGSVDDGGYSINRFGLTLYMCPPAVSASLSSDELWPANGKMHEIEATIIVDDACDAGPLDVQLTSVESDELGIEDDVHEADLNTDDRFFRLRAERDSDGDGRVYTVSYDITDGCGEVTTVQPTVTVPHDKGKNHRGKNPKGKNIRPN